jgi:glycogen debranching enzyme
MAGTVSASEWRVLKQGETFALCDPAGDITLREQGRAGLYHLGARFLSVLTLTLGDDEPVLLASRVTDDNTRLIVHLAGRNSSGGPGPLSLARTRCVRDGGSYERIELRNNGMEAISVSLAIAFQADFLDVFEVRGARRPRRGRCDAPVALEREATLAYEGLDGTRRETRLRFHPRPQILSAAEARFFLSLPPHSQEVVTLAIECTVGRGEGPRISVEQALEEASSRADNPDAPFAHVETSHPEFNRWLLRSLNDLKMLITQTPEGPYPYAGIPWFSVPFGRDGILTALECLMINPGLARGTLAHLAETQAREVNARQDAEPGKICHEERPGEMAALGEVPFKRYYGSVDVTPLFVILAGAYHERTGDLAFIERIWPNIERALNWIDTCADCDGDGFIEYSRQSSDGLVHQGWKDSGDAIFHADGRPVEGPVALSEVQGYVYAARRAAARLAIALGHGEQAADIEREALALRKRFEQHFWVESLSTYALALDGRKRPCEVRASNAGHCLFTGIAGRDRAKRVARVLLGEDHYSGWGIRTLSATEVRYNPMAYHNGSVWPHDNAVIAAGMGRYRLRHAAVRILNGLFDASRYFDRGRLPELFCGFARQLDEGPVSYPVACAPQAWASGAAFLLLQACLGLRIQALEGRICLSRPCLPEYLQFVRLSNLNVRGEFVDLLLKRRARRVEVHVTRQDADVEVVVFDRR